jgi:hypothetical protein
MPVIEPNRKGAFSAFLTTGRAEKKGRTCSALPYRMVACLALGSLASVALPSSQAFPV